MSRVPSREILFSPMNGLRVSSLPVEGAPFVHLTLTLQKGLGSENSTEFGYFSLMSTLITRGCGSLDRAEFAEDLARRGADINVFPGRDYLTLEVSILPEDLSWALQILESMLWQATLDPLETESAKEEHLLQLRARSDEKRAYLFDATRLALFEPHHPYARTMLGSETCLQEADSVSLRAYLDRFMSGVSAVLCVTGGFEQSKLEKLLSQGFRNCELSSSGQAAPDLASLIHRSGQVLNKEFPIDQAEVLVVLPAPTRDHKDYRLAHFSNEIFGGAFLSRLTRAVRIRDGLAYSADSRLVSGTSAGLIWVGLQTDRENVREALGTVRVCMDELLEQGIGEEEFGHFRDFVSSSMPFEYDALSSLTSRRLEQLLFAEPWKLEERLESFHQSVNLESTNRMFRELLQADKALVCALGKGLDDDWLQAFHEPGVDRVISSPLSALQPPSQASESCRQPELVQSNSIASLYRLSCGIHVLALPRPELASISVQLWTLTGSMDEAKGKTGLSHLLEHLMFRGTETFPDGHFDTILAQRGGLNNAFTSEDFTVYTDYVTLEGLEEALLLEADRFRNLKIDEEIFETELSVVLEERSVRVDCSPLGKAYEQLQSLAFQEHPYGHPVIGWREDLEGMSLSDLQAHYQSSTQASKLLLVVAGGCPAQKAADLAEACFADNSTESGKKDWPVLATNSPVPKLSRRKAELRERSGYSYLLLCYRFPREGHPDFEACELLARILADGDSSRLYQTFVMEKRRVLEVWSSFESQTRDHPLLHLGLATPEEIDGENLALEVTEYLAEVYSQITELELQKAKRCWRAEEAFGTDELEDWSMEIAGRVMLMAWDDVWSHEARMQKVELEDLKRVGREYFQMDSAVQIVLHGEGS